MNLLIIRPGAIGDTLLTFPVLSVLRSTYPDARIAFAGNNAVLPLALAWKLVDETSDYQSSQWGELFKTKGIQDVMLRERLRTIDLASCWLRDPDHVVERNLLAAGVKRCIVAPGRPAEGAHIHIVDYLLDTIFGDDLPPRLPDTRKGYPYMSAFHPSSPYATERRGTGGEWGAHEHVGTPLAGIRGAGVRGQPIIAIHPGSGGKQKCWPIEKFAFIIEELWRRDRSVLVVTGPADEEQRAYLQHHLVPPATGMLDFLDDAPLLEVAERLQECRCYLGNDSGITHLAALLGLPAIALFGPSEPAIWHPVGEHVTVIHEPAMEDIAVSAVITAIEQSFYD